MKQKWLYGIIGLLAGILLAVFFASNVVNSNNQGMMSMMGIRMPQNLQKEMIKEANQMHKGGMDMSMNEMMESLNDKSGDEFDKAFISEMIVHHQGAINMANLAKVNAKHIEIKNLAEDIVFAQTKEIEMMKEWQKVWGY